MILKYFLILSYTILTSCKDQNVVFPHTPNDLNSQKTDTTVIKDGSDYSIDYLMGKFDPATHPDFTAIPAKYRDEEIRYIRKDVLVAFIALYDAAVKDGFFLKIRSATRNFDNQKRIWENKWTGKTILEDGTKATKDIHDEVTRAKKILEYSSMPGTSRHHWGTDMDFNSFDNNWFEKGEGLKLYQWMQTNANKFGFCQPYSPLGGDRQSGYFEEKWHWTYMPISMVITEQAKSKLTNEMIKGFLGSNTAKEIDVVNHYILGVSPSCIKDR
jgi:D-alanyl-D-alanine carboxypeptidase